MGSTWQNSFSSLWTVVTGIITPDRRHSDQMSPFVRRMVECQSFSRFNRSGRQETSHEMRPLSRSMMATICPGSMTFLTSMAHHYVPS